MEISYKFWSERLSDLHLRHTHGDSLSNVTDPFGWGQSVFPIFEADGPNLQGAGAGFFTKNTKLAATAEHLVDFGADVYDIEEDDALGIAPLTHRERDFFGVFVNGIVFGTVRLPKDAIQIIDTYYPSLEISDEPLLELQRRQRFSRKSDIMFVGFRREFELPQAHHLPRVTANWPEPGQIVCAAGFPHLYARRFRPSEFTLDGLGITFIFGRVLEVHPEGRGSIDKNPIFIVDINYPPGMSGGPVFDMNGKVIGVVSRGLPGYGDEPGRGCVSILWTLVSKHSETWKST